MPAAAGVTYMIEERRERIQAIMAQNDIGIDLGTTTIIIAQEGKTWSGGVYAVFSVLLSVFLQLLGMDVGITTLTAPFVFSVWITVGIRYMLLTLFPAKRKVA